MFMFVLSSIKSDLSSWMLEIIQIVAARSRINHADYDDGFGGANIPMCKYFISDLGKQKLMLSRQASLSAAENKNLKIHGFHLLRQIHA